MGDDVTARPDQAPESGADKSEAPGNEAVERTAVDAAEPDAESDADTADAAGAAKLSKADKLIAKAERLKERDARRAAQRDASSGSRSTTAGPRWRSATAVLAVVGLLFAALSVVFFVAWQHQKTVNATQSRTLSTSVARDVERSSSLAAAKSYAVAFGSYDYQRLSADFAKAESMMTPSFAKNYEKTSAALAATFTAYKTEVTASVPAAAVISVTSSRAVVLVLLDQVIKSSQSTTPKINRNRLEVTLVHSQGKWLVDRTDAT